MTEENLVELRPKPQPETATPSPYWSSSRASEMIWTNFGASRPAAVPMPRTCSSNSAVEREDLDELRRLAAGGNTDAADVLEELTDDW